MYECFQRVIERKDFATMLDSFHAEYFRTILLLHNIHVPVCTLEEDVIMYRVSMFMAKGNPLLHRLNSIITRILEAGLYGKWHNDYLFSLRLDDLPIDDNDITFSDFATNELSTYYSTFSLMHLQVLFYVLLIGQSLSTLVFLVEVLYYRACTTATNSTTLYRVQREE
jgi:hypothetical protein